MDPIAQLVTSLKTHAMAGKSTARIASSRFKREILDKLAQLGFVGEIDEKKERGRSFLIIELKPLDNIKRISKPSRRVYLKSHQIPLIRAKRSRLLLTTPQGVMTDFEARKRGIGGEVILEVS